jgi:hypothetical protein
VCPSDKDMDYPNLTQWAYPYQIPFEGSLTRSGSEKGPSSAAPPLTSEASSVSSSDTGA